MSQPRDTDGFNTANDLEARQKSSANYVLYRADGSTAKRSQVHTKISIHETSHPQDVFYVSLGSESWVAEYFDEVAAYTQRGFLVHNQFVQQLVHYVTECGYNVTVAQSATGDFR